MKPRLRPITLLFLLMGSLALSPALLADDGDHDRARQALEADEILPLRIIIEKLEQDYPGQILEVELDHEDGQWIYEIKLLRDHGGLVKLKLDAGDGTLLGIKGRDIAPTVPQERKP
jgi:uncharacterized membrane protein YkoI